MFSKLKGWTTVERALINALLNDKRCWHYKAVWVAEDLVSLHEQKGVQVLHFVSLFFMEKSLPSGLLLAFVLVRICRTISSPGGALCFRRRDSLWDRKMPALAASKWSLFDSLLERAIIARPLLAKELRYFRVYLRVHPHDVTLTKLPFSHRSSYNKQGLLFGSILLGFVSLQEILSLAFCQHLKLTCLFFVVLNLPFHDSVGIAARHIDHLTSPIDR